MKKNNKRYYGWSALCGAGFVFVLLAVAPYLNIEQGSIAPSVLFALFVVAILLVNRKLPPAQAVYPYTVALTTFFLSYRIVGGYSLYQAVQNDGYLADFEVFDLKLMDGIFSVAVLLLFPLVLAIRFALSRQKVSGISKRSWKRAGISLLVLLLVIGGNWLAWGCTKPYTDDFDQYCTTFTVEKWEAYPEKRMLMLEDFQRQYPLIGKTEDEVTALLGLSQDGKYFLGNSSEGQQYLYLFLEAGVVQRTEILTEAYSFSQ